METTNVDLAINLFLFGLILIWFGLLKLLFSRLERDHAHKYEAMGRPSLFLRNNVATGLATFKFLFLREHRQLSDRKLSLFADSLLVYFVFVFVAVFGFLVLFSWGDT